MVPKLEVTGNEVNLPQFSRVSKLLAGDRELGPACRTEHMDTITLLVLPQLMVSTLRNV